MVAAKMPMPKPALFGTNSRPMPGRKRLTTAGTAGCIGCEPPTAVGCCPKSPLWRQDSGAGEAGSVVPHFTQKRVPSTFSEPQEGHAIIFLSFTTRPAGGARGRPPGRGCNFQGWKLYGPSRESSPQEPTRKLDEWRQVF